MTNTGVHKEMRSLKISGYLLHRKCTAQMKIIHFKASLAVQWSGICLAMQGTLVSSWSEKIPHSVEQLSLCITTRECSRAHEQQLYYVCLQQSSCLSSATREVTAVPYHNTEYPPPTATRESLRAARKTHHSPQIKS